MIQACGACAPDADDRDGRREHVRRGGRRRRDRRDGDRVRARAGRCAHAARRPRRRGPGHRRGRGHPLARDREARRPGLGRPRARCGPPLRRACCRNWVRTRGWARCGILQLATRDTDLSAWEWVAERATGATEISADDARAMVPVLGTVVRALHHPRAARVDGRMMCGALRRGAVDARRRGARRFGRRGARRSRRRRSSSTATRSRAPTVVIAGGAWTPRIGEQLGVQLPVGPRPRPDRAPRCRRARHRRAGRSCSRCTATTWCRGPITASRSARPSKTSASRPTRPRAACTRSCARRCA